MRAWYFKKDSKKIGLFLDGIFFFSKAKNSGIWNSIVCRSFYFQWCSLFDWTVFFFFWNFTKFDVKRNGRKFIIIKVILLLWFSCRFFYFKNPVWRMRTHGIFVCFGPYFFLLLLLLSIGVSRFAVADKIDFHFLLFFFLLLKQPHTIDRCLLTNGNKPFSTLK